MLVILVLFIFNKNGGSYTEADRDEYRLDQNVRGQGSCTICDRLNKIHASRDVYLRTDNLKFMKQTCTDCAQDNCDIYSKGKRLNLDDNNLRYYEEQCNKYLTNAEKAQRSLR